MLEIISFMHPHSMNFCNKVIKLTSAFILIFSTPNNFCFSQTIKEKILFPGEIYGNDNKKPLFQKLPADFDYNYVRCILKDYKGYMWFGTSDGLIRYDGVNIYVYENDPDLPFSLNHNTVNSIIEDKNHNLWIGTSNGLNKYNREKDNFQGADSINGENNPLNYSYISALFLGNNSQLLVGTLGYGFNILDLTNNILDHFVPDPADPKTISSERITCIQMDKDRNIWIGTQYGLNLFCEKENGFKHFYNNPNEKSSLSDNHVIRMISDNDGNLWIGTRQGGINKAIKGKNGFFFERYGKGVNGVGLSSNNIRSLFPDKYGHLWIGTEYGGLNRLNLKTGTIAVFQKEKGNNYSLGSNSINSIYGDDQDRIWIGTTNRGIYVIDEKYNKFDVYQQNVFINEGLTNNDVKGFAEDHNGKIWIATDGGGICRFDPETRSFNKFILNDDHKNLIENNAVHSIICDSENKIWIGSWGGGVDILNNNGTRICNYKIKVDKGAGNNNVIVLYQDRHGNIWAGTAGSGLFLFNKKTDEFVPISCTNDISVLTYTSYISSILLDSGNKLWVGTLNGVVTLNNYLEGRCVCTGFSPANNNLKFKRYINEVIFEDSKGRIWLGTADKGLNLYCKNDSTFTVFQKKDGLPSNSIKGILEDRECNLWISTDRGISKFNFEKKVFTNYTNEDGLNSNAFYARSCFNSKSGEFYFGCENGFNVFYPENIRKNTVPPPVYFSDFKINNKQESVGSKDSPLKKQISETKEIVLNYDQSSFTIDFVALNYTHALKNQYCYKLEGFDKDWNYIGTNRSASYTNIMPGKYAFLVKGSNNDGIWNNNPVSLIIIINPPYWKTWWALMVYIFLFFAIVYIIVKIWNERIYIKNQLKLEKSAREKERELNDLNLHFFTNISHEFRTPLSLIIAPLEMLLSSAQATLKEQLMIIYKNAIRLLQLTNNLMDLRKLEDGMTKLKVKNGDLIKLIEDIASDFKVNSEKRNINFKVEAKKNSINGWFDPEKIEIIMLNLLSNAFKYTLDNGTIKIVINTLIANEVEVKYDIKGQNISRNYAEVSVIDNGIGINPDELPFIFDKFYRAKTSEIKKNKGTGIGLALTKGFIELHHGFVFVESKPNIETCFIFLLPIEYSAYSENEIVLDQFNYSKKTIPEQIILSESCLGNALIKDDIIKDGYAEILIVEDNDELRAFLSNELGNEFNVNQADNGKLGIEMAQSVIPDLIVSDILMPEYSGIELCKVIKTDVRTCHIPVILLSAKTTVDEQIEGIETGADAYVTKPFSIHFLVAQIKQLIKSRRELYNHFKTGMYFIPNKMTEKEANQKFLKDAINYILENITDNNLNVEGLADALNLNRSNVYRRLKSLTGLTIIEFIRMVRLKEATKLIETKKYSLSDIAYKTGFTSPSYFTKSFKAQFGKTPSEFSEN
jgi:ligand-binding sensor domain-containing protein/signal transduction histidine kinase/DNA-binding response OmpR family regulator